MPGGYNERVIFDLIKSPNNQLVECEPFPSPLALVNSAPLRSLFTSELFTVFKVCVHQLRAATKALPCLHI